MHYFLKVAHALLRKSSTCHALLDPMRYFGVEIADPKEAHAKSSTRYFRGLKHALLRPEKVAHESSTSQSSTWPHALLPDAWLRQSSTWRKKIYYLTIVRRNAL